MGIEKSKLNMEQLRKEIRRLTNRQELYRVLKEELTKLDHWKQQGKWNPVGFNKKHDKHF
jgi:hypothetical protein